MARPISDQGRRSAPGIPSKPGVQAVTLPVWRGQGKACGFKALTSRFDGVVCFKQATTVAWYRPSGLLRRCRLSPLSQRFSLNIGLLALGSALAGAAWALFCGDDV